MIEALGQGFTLVMQWPTIGYLFVGILAGIFIGVIPGLGGGIGIILLLPFTFGLDAISAFALLLGMYAVTCTSDTVTSIMLGVPGTAASQATILDGYPLAQQGQAQRAFGAAFTVSAMGGVFGAIIMLISLPLLRPFVTSFMNPEIFLLAVLGLSMVGSLAGKSPSKGVAVAALGVLLAMVGYSESGAVPRYYLGMDYLLDGMPLLPIVLGLFAIPELMDLATRNKSIAKTAVGESSNYRLLLQGARDAVENWWLALRCAVIGTYIGLLPGLGGSIVDWAAYGHAVQTTKKNPKFGEGDIRGVIAPEAANNAMRGGGLIPTITFGVPGTTGYAILLSALLVQGLQPGPLMLTTQLPLTMSLIWMLVIANVAAALLMLVWSNQVAKVAFVPGALLVPGVMIFVFMGAWTATASWGDWVLLLAATVLGFMMKRGGWPRPPLILGLVLGKLMENAFLISVRAYEPSELVSRPTVLVLVVMIIATVYFSYRKTRKNSEQSDETSEDVSTDALTVKKSKDTAAFEILVGIVLAGFFAYALLQSLSWEFPVRIFPQFAVIPGLMLSVVAVRRAWKKRATDPDTFRLDSTQKADLQASLRFFGWLIAPAVLSLLVGQKIALFLFIALFLRVWTEKRFGFCLTYALAGWAILVFFYDRLLDVFWGPSYLGDLAVSALPSHWPSWLIF